MLVELLFLAHGKTEVNHHWNNILGNVALNKPSHKVQKLKTMLLFEAVVILWSLVIYLGGGVKEIFCAAWLSVSSYSFQNPGLVPYMIKHDLQEVHLYLGGSASRIAENVWQLFWREVLI